MYIINNGPLAAAMLVFYTASALTSLVFYNKHKICNILSNLLSSIAAAAGIWLSIANIVEGTQKTVIASFSMSVPHIAFNLYIDKLSAFFILALSILVLAVSIYSIGYISHYYNKRNVGMFNFLYNTFILSMIFVMTSGNVIGFLISWELMSLLSYFLVIFEGEHAENRKAGTLYLIMTHIGTAFLTIAFMLTYKYTHSLEIGVNIGAVPASIKSIVFVLLLIGFGTKAGVIPFHVWLPYAHPAAPSNVSALMSGIMIKTAIYGILRFAFISFTDKPMWWGVLILTAGAVSAVLGVAYALMEHNIKRLLAYSSIENIGIILMGMGISFMAYSSGNMVLCGLSMMAALFHLLNHTLFKGALFLGAGSIHYATHTKDMEELGGLIKKMPFTGLLFLIAALSISAIPPFNGFASEWMTYQSLFMSLGSNTSAINLISMLTVAALAMAGALAAACFVKLIGISFLGLPRSEHAESAREVPASMRIGQGLLTLLCVILGIFPTLALRLIDRVNLEMIGTTLISDLQGGAFFVYYPLSINKNAISPIAVVIMGVVIASVTFILVKLAGGHSKERKYGTWDCGFVGLNPRMQYSATGYSKPLRIVLKPLYMPGREIKTEEGASPYYHKSIKYIVSTQSLFELYFYAPIIRLFAQFSKRTRHSIQTGSIHAYLIYIFVTMIALLVYYVLS
ncbi:MAG TPA: hydrogenase 4 subunit B [Clostridia bacterium]|nr:hydrogenase 4 subunit B [Clostridia bacterium]